VPSAAVRLNFPDINRHTAVTNQRITTPDIEDGIVRLLEAHDTMLMAIHGSAPSASRALDVALISVIGGLLGGLVGLLLPAWWLQPVLHQMRQATPKLFS
jgi:hypothetical protein